MGDLCMRARLTRRTAAAPVLALSAALMVFGVSGASAITQTPNGPETLPATDTPMWQTNGAVWATVVRNGVLFVGGDFTSIRPPNTPAGTGEVAMSHLAAFDVATGTPCTVAAPCGTGHDFVWSNNSVAGRVYALSATPDGKTLYAGGDFSQVKGQ